MCLLALGHGTACSCPSSSGDSWYRSVSPFREELRCRPGVEGGYVAQAYHLYVPLLEGHCPSVPRHLPPGPCGGGIQCFQEIIQTFQNVETYTNPQPRHPMGRRWRAGERTRKPGPRTRLQVVSSECPSERARDKPGPVPLPNNWWKAARNQGATVTKEPRKEERESHTLAPPPG